ncbi:sensor histidine kinase [Roseobacter sinensis]|uniref:histidine kinase n=1 Tax=Roseobacter sinensis TaxID=2931391 RepID=A0ABT3BH30_9RHOB|nr:PAS domain-containing sensor histidine kinase [Roseobacter sp. WL0113]MCV3272694.1 PAS domain-containing sensor histidine kinase [Roseobacter sp. WL0113]
MQVAAPQSVETAPGPSGARSTAFWERLAEVVPGVIYLFNHQTMSNEYVNRSVHDLLGYSAEEIADMGPNMLATAVLEEDQPGVMSYLAALRHLGEGEEASHVYRVRRADGAVRWFRSVDSVFEREADGRVLRHIGIALDVTAQMAIEAELRQVNEDLEERIRARTAELERLNRELGIRMEARTAELQDVKRDLEDLTYVATHDLRVPVNNMGSLTHMLSEAEPLLPPEHVETLGWLRDVSDQASEKLDALICVAQARSGALKAFEEVDLARITDQALVNLHFQITRTRAVVKTRFDVPAVWFVPREMENILQSMIGNAIKYHVPGRRPRIQLLSRRHADHVEISIEDNGTGLDLPRDADKVFGLFKRAHTTPGGAGVSLYAIRRVLERVGGRIDVTSTPGRGSRFSICLPHRPEPS